MKSGKATITLAALAFSGAAAAADFSFTGNLNGPNDVQLFNFSVGAPSTVTLRSWSYAGGVNAAGTPIARGGFDPILAVFDSGGLRIGENDDASTSAVATDPVTGRRFDVFLQSPLATGNYVVSVMAYSNFSVGPNLSNGFTGGGSFTDVTGNLRDSHWAFDILNVNAATSVGQTPTDGPTAPVPEPDTYAMMLAGLGILAFLHRRKKPQSA
ncbi:MAG: sorting protein [Betaproteobacteria bacterium]|nr:sorting protein [Betaproteobacteria bacterium]